MRGPFPVERLSTSSGRGWVAVMSCHKLSAGDGYTYLTRQVAAHDATHAIGPGGLEGYYSQAGEAPGMWVGSGTAGLGIDLFTPVTSVQMVAVFGEGRHPETDAPLGKAFTLAPTSSEFSRTVAARIAAHNTAAGRAAGDPVPAQLRSRIRTDVGRELFQAEHGRAPADARELSSFIATASRLASDTVAGYDLTFSPVKSVSTLWAVADPAIAREVEAAHRSAVADTMRWLEEQATFTRRGHAGARQVDDAGVDRGRVRAP